MFIRHIIQQVLIIFLMSQSLVFSDEVILPASGQKSIGSLPTLSPLFSEQRLKDTKAIRKDTQDILRTVLGGTPHEREAKAEELAHNQEKLADFLDTLPSMMPRSNTSSEDTAKTALLVDEIDELLEEELTTPLLARTIVSLSIKEASLSEAIELISKTAKLSFSIDSAARGFIPLAHFVQAPLSKVLKTILAHMPKKTALVHDAGVFRILPLEKAKKVLKKRAHERWESGLVSAKVTLEHIQMSQSVMLRIEKMWEHIISGKRSVGHYILCEEASRQVFMRGTKKHVQALQAFLHDIDVSLPQVVIDARIVLATKDFERSWGLQWSHLFNRRSSVCNDFEIVGSGPLEDIRNCPKQQSKCNLFDWALNLFPPTALASRTLALPLVFGGSDLDTKRLNIVLNAAENQGDVQTLLKPSLLTAHKEPAEILVGSRVPIQTVVKETIDGTLRDITTATYIDVGTKLKIKPIISPNRKQVFLDIYVENSCLNGRCGNFPIIRTTRAHNRVVLGSGQTTLIGGLIESNTNDENNALPLLGQIPLFGWLFKGVRKVKKESQMLIFLTPKIR